jgi:hypothetical protein
LLRHAPIGDGSRFADSSGSVGASEHHDHSSIFKGDEDIGGCGKRKNERPIGGLTVGKILESVLDSQEKLWSSLRGNSLQVVSRIIRCNQGGYGYVLSNCNGCGHEEYLANCSCGDRNCPNCGAAQRSQWAQGIAEKFLPTRAFHVVFTLPHNLNSTILANKKPMLSLLMKAAAETLMEFSANHKQLNGTPFLLSVLHTWTQDLRFHPHIHCLISAGALQESGQWFEFKGKFLFSIKALARVFRGKMLAGIDALVRSGAITLPIPRQDDASISDFFDVIPKKWVVYCKAPYKSTNVVIRYFARYANRTAISNKRLCGFEDNIVKIACRNDSSEPEPDTKSSTPHFVNISGEEFVERFIQHIPPYGMHRIRRYGLLSGRTSAEKISRLEKIIPRNLEDKKMATQKELPPACRICKSTDIHISIFRRNQNNSKNEWLNGPLPSSLSSTKRGVDTS